MYDGAFGRREKVRENMRKCEKGTDQGVRTPSFSNFLELATTLLEVDVLQLSRTVYNSLAVDS